MAKQTDQYATLLTPGSKKVSVISRRVGSRDRMSVIAVCNDEGAADKIVEGLHLRQGEVAKLEVPAQKVLKELRERLEAERGVSKSLQIKIRECEDKLVTIKHERDMAQSDLTRMRAERDQLAKERNAMMAATEKV